MINHGIWNFNMSTKRREIRDLAVKLPGFCSLAVPQCPRQVPGDTLAHTTCPIVPGTSTWHCTALYYIVVYCTVHCTIQYSTVPAHSAVNIVHYLTIELLCYLGATTAPLQLHYSATTAPLLHIGNGRSMEWRPNPRYSTATLHHTADGL